MVGERVFLSSLTWLSNHQCLHIRWCGREAESWAWKSDRPNFKPSSIVISVALEKSPHPFELHFLHKMRVPLLLTL